jgi:hypothetical protein
VRLRSDALVRLLALVPFASLALAGVAAGQVTKPLTPSQKVAPGILVARIDTNCAVFKSAIKTEKPTRVISVRAKAWTLASDSDAAAAQRLQSYTLAEVWKHAGNYVWVRSHTLASGGVTHATHLCFRNDGTLARVRQATTVPALDAASAQLAYYNTDGSVIQKSALFEAGDPTIAKRVKALPYFNLLP